MYGVYGSLAVLIKRQKSEKFRKAELRAKLKSQKELYLDVYKTKDEFDFPEISSIEMKKLKDQIRKDFRKEKIKTILSYLAISLIVVSVVVYIYLRKQ